MPDGSGGPDGSVGVRYIRFPGAAYYVAGDARGVGYEARSAYVPTGADPGARSLTAGEAWADGGVFAFLGTGPASAGTFVAAVRALVAAQPWTGTRVLWVTDPNLPPSQWQLAGLRLYAQTATGGLLSALTTVPFRNYAVLADGDLPVRLDETGALVVQPAAPGDIRVSTDDGATELPLVAGPLTVPLGAGATAGCLVLDLQVPIGADGPGHLDALDVGCRFFYDDPELAGSGVLTSVRFPVLDPALPAGGPDAATSLDLACVLDPVAPLDPDRTFLQFTGSGPLRSHYRTNLGSVVDLAPVAARLQFAARQTGLAPSDADPLYLVPHGTFTVHPSGGEPAPALMCGLGATEYVGLGQTRLRFAAGAPAYAPNFDPAATTGTAGPGPRLAGPVSTAWAALSAPDGPVYFAQPQGAALFGSGTPAAASAAAPAASGPLPFFEIPAATLPRDDDPVAAGTYPLVPMAGLTGDLEAAARLEVQVLSQQRREVIHGLTPAAAVAPPAPQPAAARATVPRALALAAAGTDALVAATPQGLLATFSADRTRWDLLKIAQSSLAQADGTVQPTLLALADVVDPLKAALLTNQQFLVVSNASALASHMSGHSQVVVANYRFELDPGQWARHGTIMLLKNCDKPLVELIADVNTWVLGAQFNIRPSATQARLQAIVDDALASADPLMAPFQALLRDAGWNGILFLSAYLPLDALPPEIAGLAAGIDAARFYAHHLGVNQTPVGADLVMRDSSVFGLLSYADDRPLATSGYDFRVASLRIRFANSALADFRSRVRLALNELFGTAVRQDGAPDNVLEIDGSYQRHGSTGTYVFTESRPTTYRPVRNDPALRGARVVQAQFATGTPPAPGTSGAGAVVTSAFSFWGQLELAALSTGTAQAGDVAPFDVLSFDSLVFADLRLAMSFPAGSPGARTFALDVTHATFDSGASVARPQSLAAHFPVTPRGLVAGTGGTTPGDAGYAAVVTDLQTTAVKAPWYGLVYDLNLGSVGSLAAGVGIVVTLGVFWAPNGQGLPVSIGLRLPGTTSAKDEITIEGVLKIGMFAIILSYTQGAFLLAFDGVALKVFGQALPPGGSFDILVFGDPDPSAGASSLGWYGAYRKDAPKTPASTTAAPPAAALRAAAPAASPSKPIGQAVREESP
jgi:hypothetical protein